MGGVSTWLDSSVRDRKHSRWYQYEAEERWGERIGYLERTVGQKRHLRNKFE